MSDKRSRFTTGRGGRSATCGLAAVMGSDGILMDHAGLLRAADRVLRGPKDPRTMGRQAGCGCGGRRRSREDDDGRWTVSCSCGRSATGETELEARRKLEAR